VHEHRKQRKKGVSKKNLFSLKKDYLKENDTIKSKFNQLKNNNIIIEEKTKKVKTKPIINNINQNNNRNNNNIIINNNLNLSVITLKECVRIETEESHRTIRNLVKRISSSTIMNSLTDSHHSLLTESSFSIITTTSIDSFNSKEGSGGANHPNIIINNNYNVFSKVSNPKQSTLIQNRNNSISNSRKEFKIMLLNCCNTNKES